MINPGIFREYDIRGIADQDLTDCAVSALAQAFAEYLRQIGARTLSVGYDMRLSSPRIRNSFINSLIHSGLDVIDISLCPTPALYFSLFHLKTDAGVMITASHNPAEFNGFKLCVGKETIYGEEIQKVRKIGEKLSTTSHERKAPLIGNIVVHPILPQYKAYLVDAFTRYREVPLKIVLDAGNATAGLAAPEVIRAMGCEVIELYSEPDGTFPNHHPDPTDAYNLTALIKTVKEQHADVGIAFDGDADRIGVVDRDGTIIWGDRLMILFSRDILRNRPGATFISEVKSSQTMYDDIRAHGGNAIMWKTGHSLIKAKMKETGAVMAAEMSGHLFFADRYFGYDDAIYSACRLVELLKKEQSKSGRQVTIASLIEDVPGTVATPEIRIDCPDTIKFAVVDKMKEIFTNGSGIDLRPREVITIDGMRAIFENGWGLVRASNTQPALVLRFEARDRESLETIKAMMESKLNSIKRDIAE